MDSKKKLTIVVPSYNVENYLAETLKSLVDCKKLKELEIIVVNDGSKDKTLEVAQSFADRCLDSIRIVDKENGGHGSTINSGLSIASGDYFLVIDGDDWVDSVVLDEFIDFISDLYSDVVITGHYRNYILTGKEEMYGYSEQKGVRKDVEYLLQKGYRIPMTDICYRTELLKKVDLVIQENTFYVDEEFCSLPFAKADTVTFFSKGFYHYRIGDVNQSISSSNVVKRIEHKKRVFARVMSSVNKADMKESNYQYIYEKMLGVANSILMVYYIYFPDKKEGRVGGDAFYEYLKTDYPDVAEACSRYKKAFRCMNRFHISDKEWNRYKSLKHRLTRSRRWNIKSI